MSFDLSDKVESAFSDVLSCDLSHDSVVLAVCARRFVACLELSTPPTKHPLLAYNFELLPVDEVARSCEFYLGFFQGFLSGNHSSLDEGHYLSVLQASYKTLGSQLPVFDALAHEHENVVLGFRHAYASIRK